MRYQAILKKRLCASESLKMEVNEFFCGYFVTYFGSAFFIKRISMYILFLALKRNKIYTQVVSDI